MRTYTVTQDTGTDIGWHVLDGDGRTIMFYESLHTAQEQAAAFSHHLSYQECAERWPRLTRCVQWVLIGSQSEAACCIRDYRDGHRYGSEAVSWSGLSPADRIRQAASPDVRRIVRLSSDGGRIR